jgi:hypothetical protein
MVKRESAWSETAKKLNEIRMHIKAAELIEAELQKELIELSEGVDSYDESGLTFKQFERKGTVDYSKIPQLHDLNLEVFRKPNAYYWKLSKV